MFAIADIVVVSTSLCFWHRCRINGGATNKWHKDRFAYSTLCVCVCIYMRVVDPTIPER